MNKLTVAIVVLLLLSLSCRRATSPISKSESPQAVDVSARDASESGTPADAYPEKPEVKRLLYRANIEFEDGRFREALAIVNRALKVDADSVAASELRNRINRILVRS